MVKDFARPFVNNLAVDMVSAQNQMFADAILVSVVTHAKMLDVQVKYCQILNPIGTVLFSVVSLPS